MAEEFYTDEFDLTPAEEPKKDLPILEIPKVKKQTKFEDIVFGPDIPLKTTFTAKAPEALYKSIKSKFTGEEYKPEEIDPLQGFVAGIIDGTIKIPYGIVNITAEIADALRSDNVPINEGYVAQLEKYFSNSVLGKIQSGAEDVVKESAIGRLTSGLVQLYSYGRVGAAAVEKASEKALQIYNKFSKAAKVNKVAAATPGATAAGIRAKDLNKLSGTQRFAAITVGGAGGSSLIADVEDVGTWGDWLGGPSALDREQRPETNDDAARKLWNRFKFGVEGAAISVPIAYGINKVAKRIAEAGKDLKYSDSQFDQWINQYIVEPFSPSGNKSKALFQGIKRVEGEINASQVTAKDMIMDIDQTLYKIAKEAGLSTGNKNWKRIIGRLDELLTSGDDIVKDGKIIFPGFQQTRLNQFYEFLKEVGLNEKQGKLLVDHMSRVRQQFNVFKNTILQGNNVVAGSEDFAKLMSERMRNIFNSEYEIVKGKSILPMLNYKPTDSVIQEVKEVFQRYAKNNGVNLTAQDLDVIIDDIYRNIKFNPLTKTPEFPLTIFSVLDDNATQIINIADNIKGGKFQPSTLIQSEKDLRAFQRFYGQKRDLRNTIVNTMSDLATLSAKDNFYNTMAKESEKLIQEGKRGIVYNTRFDAMRGLPNQTIIADKNGLQLSSPLGESIYSNPLNGKFTSQQWKDALQFSEKMMFDKFAQSLLYQNLFLIPKGLTQISKTMLGPFTHTRNFLTSGQFAFGNGNLFVNPVRMMQNFKRAWNTIQPQLLYRNTPKDQAIYKFLLEEGVTSSSATARDIAGLMDDIGKHGDVYMRFFGKFGKAMKKVYQTAGDLYVAEDDFWKMYNFFAEFDKYQGAYKKAFDKGLIKTMPNDLQIMKEAAAIVRDTVPNYGMIGPFGQGSRRLPFGNFVSWPIEVTRTGSNVYSLSMKEMNNPVLADIGRKRLVGFAAAIGTAPVVAGTVLAGMYGVSKAAISAVRELAAPKWAQDSTLFVIRDKDGKFKYIDASASMVYDTLVNPFQAAVAQVEQNRIFDPKQPLSVGLINGFGRGIGRFLRPYVEESLWFNVLNNLFIRDGRTPDGRKLWNEKAPIGEKIAEAFKYFVGEVAPLSWKQMERLTLAINELPGPRGEKYELSDEVAGFYGLRAIKVDPIKNLNYKINDFKDGLNKTRALFSGQLLKGRPLSEEDIIERFYVANQQRFEEFKNMKRKIKAANILEAKEDDIAELFKRRSEPRNYYAIIDNEFRPLKLTKSDIRESERLKEELSQDFNLAKLPPGLTDKTQDILFQMMDDMYELKLDKDFNKQIPLSKYLPKKTSSIQGSVAPLPEQPMPNPQVVQSPQPMGLTQQGLTPTENALLSDEEKQIRLRQRGLV